MLTRSKHKTGSVFAAVALLVGTAVGAGIFGLPYVVSQSGYFIGIFYLISLGIVSAIVNLAYGEVVLSTKGNHQLPAYVEKYLGKNWKILAMISLFLGFYGALSAYLLEVGHLLHAITIPYIDTSPRLLSLIFFIFVSTALLLGLRAIANAEKIMFIALFILIILLVIVGFNSFNLSNLGTYNFNNAFLPYGVVLFAFAAASAVPDMKNVLENNRTALKKAILIGSFLPIIIYIIFVTLTVGITGIETSESAIIGLGNILGNQALVLGSLFGIISMSTSFLILGLVLKEVFEYDLKQKPLISWLLVIIPPLAIVMLGLLSFIEILGVSGALVGGIDGLILMMMHRRLKNKRDNKPEYSLPNSKLLYYPMFTVFILGIAYEVYEVFNIIS
ncbi:MAG: aromatic amino acid transport family protein [bacterium]|nr:aromatic amino acid transport family protein [bacterium]